MRFTFSKYLRNYTIRVVSTSAVDLQAGTLVGITSTGIVKATNSDVTGPKFLVAEDYKANEPTIVVFVIDKEDILAGYAPEAVVVGGDYATDGKVVTAVTAKPIVKILSKGTLKVVDGSTTYTDVTFTVIGG